MGMMMLPASMMPLGMFFFAQLIEFLLLGFIEHIPEGLLHFRTDLHDPCPDRLHFFNGLVDLGLIGFAGFFQATYGLVFRFQFFFQGFDLLPEFCPDFLYLGLLLIAESQLLPDAFIMAGRIAVHGLHGSRCKYQQKLYQQEAERTVQ
jgi:hypothetical protein